MTAPRGNDLEALTATTESSNDSWSINDRSPTYSPISSVSPSGSAELQDSLPTGTVLLAAVAGPLLPTAVHSPSPRFPHPYNHVHQASAKEEDLGLDTLDWNDHEEEKDELESLDGLSLLREPEENVPGMQEYNYFPTSNSQSIQEDGMPIA